MMHTPAHHSATAAQISIDAAPAITGPDFAFVSHGSIVLLTPRTQAAKDWVEQNLTNPETQFWGRSVVIEPRYWEPIYTGIQNDGLTVL